MLPSNQRALGAAGLLVVALTGFAYAGDAVIPPTSAPIGDHVEAAPVLPDAGSSSYERRGESAAPTSTSFTHKNKLICFDGAAGTPGSILFANEGPGTLTMGMIVKVVIEPTGKVISYVLPYDLPPNTGVKWYGAYRPGLENVTCTFTAAEHLHKRGITLHL